MEVNAQRPAARGAFLSFVEDGVAKRRERNEWQSGELSERQVAAGNFCDTSRSENLDVPKANDYHE